MSAVYIPFSPGQFFVLHYAVFSETPIFVKAAITMPVPSLI